MDIGELATHAQEPNGAGGLEPATIGTPLNLRQKLAQVRREVGYIQKRGKNQFHNYTYAMAADIAGAIGDRLAALNVVLGRRNLNIKRSELQHDRGTETVVEVTVDYEFIDGDSDESLTVPSYGEGRDRGDKAPYKALTGALKYALIQTVMIATGDDPEDERPDNGTAPKEGQTNDRLITPEEARVLCDLIDQTGTDVEKVLEYYRVARIEEMTESTYRRAEEALERKRSRQTGREECADAQV